MKHLLLSLTLLSLCLCANAQNVVKNNSDNAVNSLTIEANDSIPTFACVPKVQMKVDIQHEGPYGEYGSYSHVYQVMEQAQFFQPSYP